MGRTELLKVTARIIVGLLFCLILRVRLTLAGCLALVAGLKSDDVRLIARSARIAAELEGLAHGSCIFDVRLGRGDDLRRPREAEARLDEVCI